ncbi:hypothetical protein LINPERPRIM_LOCUS40745 [Linum perenne]
MGTNRPLCGCGQWLLSKLFGRRAILDDVFLVVASMGELVCAIFFWWVDPELDEHVKHIVVGLLWKIHVMERVNYRPNFGDRCKKFGCYVLISICMKHPNLF